MDRQVFSTSLAPDCYIGQVAGDLQVKGWNLPQISLEAAPDTLQVSAEDDQLHLSCTADCEIRLPQASLLEIETVHGDVGIKLLDEHLKIGTVFGSLELREAASLEAVVIHGSFMARNITDDLSIQQIMGDAEIRRGEGACRLASVLGDASVIGACGDLFLQANGDVHLNLSGLNGVEYNIQAGGDVVCSLPASAGLTLNLSSRAKSIRIQLPDLKENLDQQDFSHQLGDGGISITVKAVGDISLVVQQSPWETEMPFMVDYGEQIARQVESQIGQQMEEVTLRLKEHMDRLSEDLGRLGMSPEETERIVDQAMRISERETARAQEKMRRAQEKLERKLEEAQRKTEQRARAAERTSWVQDRRSRARLWPIPPTPARPAGEPPAASEEERMMILQMLEQKKISIDEAEKLLQALEGQS